LNSGTTTQAWESLVLKEALAALGGSEELLKLLEFLQKQGEGDLRDWLIDEGMAEAFSGEKAEEMREWLLSLGPEEKKLAVRIGFSAGRGLLGNEEGLKSYLSAYTDVNIQSAILSGYCCAFAGEHPEQAVSKFMSLRPEAMDASGVSFVMESLPAGTDFALAGSGIPDDSKTLAKRARTAMLENWSGVDPQAAANYVMANTRSVHADQLEVVMKRWLAADEKSALAWARSLRSAEHLDQAYIAQATVFAKSDLARAWEAAGRVSDFDQRIKAVTPVFKVWEGRDPQGAKLAWDLMFNQE
jgi:hypothetical protein